ncbi:hypothetical protein EVAR_2324_1 [Eumeta japonica]|uniref:Uncharacterized protein n=1 Tax=Eumeta variegata TaxID=151549 RepID=A0A4C1SFX9_EUMVA|nr:hypothetical protein EVAR_2324_1 [Eumeta japonica]
MTPNGRTFSSMKLCPNGRHGELPPLRAKSRCVVNFTPSRVRTSSRVALTRILIYATPRRPWGRARPRLKRSALNWELLTVIVTNAMTPSARDN